MSNSFSYAQVGGQLGRDPEIKSTPGGTKVVTFSLAVEKGFKDKKFTSWFNVTAFGDVGTIAEQHLKKGKGARVTGDLQIRSWDDPKTGQKKYATEIIAYKIDFMDSGSSRDSGGSTRQTAAPAPRTQAAPAPRGAAPASDPFNTEISDDDIPF